MGYRVVVDFDLCESNARCMEAAPEVSGLVGSSTSLTVLCTSRSPLHVREIGRAHV